MTGYVADLSWKSGARAIEKLDRLRSTMAVNVLSYIRWWKRLPRAANHNGHNGENKAALSFARRWIKQYGNFACRGAAIEALQKAAVVSVTT